MNYFLSSNVCSVFSGDVPYGLKERVLLSIFEKKNLFVLLNQMTYFDYLFLREKKIVLVLLNGMTMF